MTDEEVSRETLREIRALRLWIISFIMILVFVLYLVNDQKTMISRHDLQINNIKRRDDRIEERLQDLEQPKGDHHESERSNDPTR